MYWRATFLTNSALILNNHIKLRREIVPNSMAYLGKADMAS